MYILTLQIQIFEPFSILGLEAGVSESEIKKAYRKLSILYHPDKNPDPGWRCLMIAIYNYGSLMETGNVLVAVG